MSIKLTTRQQGVLSRIAEGELPAGVNEYGVWRYRYGSDEYVTSEVKALRRKGAIDLTVLGLGSGVAMNVTKAGLAHLQTA